MSTFRRAIFWLAVVTAWWTALAPFEIFNEKLWADARGAEFEFASSLVRHLANAWVFRVPLSMLVLWLAARWPLGRTRPRNLLVHLTGLAISVVYIALAVLTLNDRVGWYATLPSFGELLGRLASFNLLYYALFTLGAHAIHYARQHRLQAERLARAELQMLRAQMQPHFLFNALNTIASLIPEQPEAAEAMIARLGALLRSSLEHDGTEEVLLADELDVVRAYVDIERARYADRLFVDWEIEPETLDALVPSLLLQPLVENAVRHGLLPRAAAGRLAVRAWRADDQLLLQISDDGVGLPARPVDRIGLSNIRARLAQLYGSRQTFTLEPRPGGGTTATVRLPFSEQRSRTRAPAPARPFATTTPPPRSEAEPVG